MKRLIITPTAYTFKDETLNDPTGTRTLSDDELWEIFDALRDVMASDAFLEDVEKRLASLGNPIPDNEYIEFPIEHERFSKTYSDKHISNLKDKMPFKSNPDFLTDCWWFGGK